MAKRFTDSAKWGKSFFHNLPLKMKLAWVYLCDNCDHAGIWDINTDLMSYQIGEQITLVDLLSAFPNKLEQFEDKLFIQSFIDFQYGNLNPTNKVHKSVLDRVSHLKSSRLNAKTEKKEGPCMGLGRGIGRAMEMDKEMEEEEEKEMDMELEVEMEKDAPCINLESAKEPLKKIIEGTKPDNRSQYEKVFGKKPSEELL